MFLKYRGIQLKYYSACVPCLKISLRQIASSPQSINLLVLKPKEARIYMQVTLETHYVALNTTVHILLLFFVLLFSHQMAFGATAVFSAHCKVISLFYCTSCGVLEFLSPRQNISLSLYPKLV